MNTQTLWIHPASYTYRSDYPERMIETLWVERQGWGYLMRRDLWIPTDLSVEELEAQGYERWTPPGKDDAFRCPSCGMYICRVPGYLARKHIQACGAGGEDWQKIEDAMISNIRMEMYHQRLLEEKRRELEEQMELARQERFDRIREEQQARQLAKDRKRRLREETREKLRKK